MKRIRCGNCLLSGTSGGLFRGGLIVATAMIIGTCSAAYGGSRQQVAPPEVKDQAISRLLTFLKDIATLSPLPSGTDSDLAQRWPRNPVRRFKAFGSNTVERANRPTDLRVYESAVSSDPRSGHAWSVEVYGREILGDIAADGKRIVIFVDGALAGRLSEEPAPGLQDCLPVGVGIARAIAYAKAAGISTRDLSLRSVRLADTNVPPSEASRTWEITWDRTVNGVVYEGQHVSCSLDAHRGRLLSFGARLASPPPSNMIVSVGPSDALRIAEEFVRINGITLAGGSWVSHLEIAHPTDYWDNLRIAGRPRILTRSTNTRLVWTVRVPAIYHDAVLEWTYLWVDASDGSVVGGELNGSRGPIQRPLTRDFFLRLLGTAKEVCVQSGKADALRVHVIRPYVDRLRYYGAISQVYGLSSKERPHAEGAPTRIVVTTSDDKTTTLNYYSTDNLLVDGDEYSARIGPLLRALLLEGCSTGQARK